MVKYITSACCGLVSASRQLTTNANVRHTMNIEIENIFSRSSEEFDKAYPDGGMSLEITAFGIKPTLGELKKFYISQDYDPQDLAHICYETICEEELKNELSTFFVKAQIGLNKYDTESLVALIVGVADEGLIKVQADDEKWCYSLSVLASTNGNHYLYDFWWQYD